MFLTMGFVRSPNLGLLPVLSSHQAPVSCCMHRVLILQGIAVREVVFILPVSRLPAFEKYQDVPWSAAAKKIARKRGEK